MVVNKAFFGQIVASVRGADTLDAVAEHGGPTRQRQAQIEKGDPVVLTPAVLDQLDIAAGWPRATSEVLLTPPRPPAWDVSQRLYRLEHNALGLDDTGSAVAMPPVLAVANPAALIPVIARWYGPVLIDVPSGDPAERFLMAFNLRSHRIDQHRMRRTGVDEPYAAKPVAIDPFPLARDTRSAIKLLEGIEAFTHRTSPQTQARRSTMTLQRMAVTTLFVAMTAGNSRRSGLAVLSDLSADQPDPGLLNAWREFFETTQLSSGFEHFSTEAMKMFRPLLDLKDFHIDLGLGPGDDAGMLSVESRDDVEILNPHNLNDRILFYDSTICPFVPAVVDWAYAKKHLTPLLITATTDPFLVEPGSPPLLPNTSVILLTDAAELSYPHRRPLTCARLVQPRAGSAILMPAAGPVTTRSQTQRVWLDDTTDSVLSGPTQTGARTVADFPTARQHFGTFVTANVRHISGPGPDPSIVLTDDDGRQLVVEWVRSENAGDDADYAASILDLAGIGRKDIVRPKIGRTRTRGTILTRPPGPLNLALGTIKGSDGTHRVTIDLREQYRLGVIAGDRPAVTDMIATAAAMLCTQAPQSDLAVIGVTSGSPRPWVTLADLDHTVAFAGIGIGTRDDTAIARWFDTELLQLITRRDRLLQHAGARDVTEYRSGGGIMPTLLVIIDGLAVDTGAYTALAEVFDRLDELDIRVILCGHDPVPAAEMLASRHAENWLWLPSTFTAWLPGGPPERIPELIGLTATFDNSAPCALLRSGGIIDDFDPWLMGELSR
ncbi:hypothetical protein JNN96_37535 [Mycobacterium sp. DSM 3803]|nr:hypothetical protein [Mycobacterium sp. DSM 3803]